MHEVLRKLNLMKYLHFMCNNLHNRKNRHSSKYHVYGINEGLLLGIYMYFYLTFFYISSYFKINNKFFASLRSHNHLIL